jgi:hypothetical protein
VFHRGNAVKNTELLEVLRGKGVEALHHVNSVRTSCTFLGAGRMLSRAYVENNRLAQTIQTSDAIDKKFGIWGDVFLDGVDIHSRARRNNHYGPVLFVLDLESVLRDKSLEGCVRITRENPIHWRIDQAEEERFFTSCKDFAESYSFGDFGRMFTVRTKEGWIPLQPHLRVIILDDPSIQDRKKDAFQNARDALQQSAKTGGINVEVRKRSCSEICRCKEIYRKGWTFAHKSMFSI